MGGRLWGVWRTFFRDVTILKNFGEGLRGGVGGGRIIIIYRFSPCRGDGMMSCLMRMGNIWVAEWNE